MELAAEDIPPTDGGRHLDAVLRRGNEAVLTPLRKEGMDEVDMVAFLNIAENRAFFTAEVKGIPTDLRNFQFGSQSALHGNHAAFQQTEAFVLAILVALFEKQLHTETDAHQRLSLGCFFQNNLVHTALPQFFRCIAEGTDTGQNDPIRRSNDSRIAGHDCLHANARKGGSERKEIANAVINNRYHQSIPFVDGISFSARGSIETAADRARPSALKTPSIMWWELLPAN